MLAREAARLALGTPAAGGAEGEAGLRAALPLLAPLQPLAEASLRVDIEDGDAGIAGQRDRQMGGHCGFPRAALLLRDGDDLAGHGASPR